MIVDIGALHCSRYVCFSVCGGVSWGGEGACVAFTDSIVPY